MYKRLCLNCPDNQRCMTYEVPHCLASISSGMCTKTNSKTESHDTLYANGSVVSDMKIIYTPSAITLP